MRSLVVLFAVAAVAVAAPQYVALDVLGRPIEPVEVVAARALHYQAKALTGHILKKRSVGHAVAYSVPSAVSHQSRVDVRTSPAVVESVVAAPVVQPAVVEARTVYAAPAAAAVYTPASAVSHQSRVDVRTSPAVAVPVAHSVIAEPVLARSVYTPAATVYAGGAAVTHQSRVDLQSSPAVVTEEVVAPAVVEARSVWAPTVYTSTW